MSQNQSHFTKTDQNRILKPVLAFGMVAAFTLGFVAGNSHGRYTAEETFIKHTRATQEFRRQACLQWAGKTNSAGVFTSYGLCLLRERPSEKKSLQPDSVRDTI